ncbi:MAG TPA: hypothetical protein VJ814_03670 [Gaiellaceae bacterium]|nr:hypothetical protein [Gaiellaceae bacterium]
MDPAVLASVVVDCAAVAGLGWLLRSSDRRRAGSVAAERAALERVRGELKRLLTAAEARARALEASLEPPRLRIDPAEARLLRDLGFKSRADRADTAAGNPHHPPPSSRHEDPWP